MTEVDVDSIHTDQQTTPVPVGGGSGRTEALTIAALATCEDRDVALREASALTDQALRRTGRGLDLTQADLSGLDLSGFDLRGATLNRASLFGTKMMGCNLGRASMVCAGIEVISTREWSPIPDDTGVLNHFGRCLIGRGALGR